LTLPRPKRAERASDITELDDLPGLLSLRCYIRRSRGLLVFFDATAAAATTLALATSLENRVRDPSHNTEGAEHEEQTEGDESGKSERHHDVEILRGGLGAAEERDGVGPARNRPDARVRRQLDEPYKSTVLGMLLRSRAAHNEPESLSIVLMHGSPTSFCPTFSSVAVHLPCETVVEKNAE
jgi:hypothetical protein